MGAALSAAMLATGLVLGTVVGPRTPVSLASGARRVIAIVQQSPIVAPTIASPSDAAPPSPPSSPAAPEPLSAGAPSEPFAGGPPADTSPGEATSDEATAPPPAKPDAAELSAAPKLPPVKHVWLVSLTGQRYEETWGPQATEPELVTLRSQGTLLSHSFAVAHGSVPGAVALLSGQGPNPATEADCPTAAPLVPGSIAKDDTLQQAQGVGCLYPAAVRTLPDQLTTGGLTWKGYIESIASPDPAGMQTCRHAASGQVDPFATPRPGDPYLSTRNPFVFFATIVGDSSCATNVVGLDRLAGDLATPDETPAFSYIVPDTCHDGRDVPCAEGAPGGLAAAGPWLAGIVDQIRASPSYRAGGLIIITGDQAPADGPRADARGCRCASDASPGASSGVSPANPVKGGGRVGTLLISPVVPAGVTVAQRFDQISILKSIEDLFGLTHLGAAADPARKPLAPTAYQAPVSTGP